jgi:hypothetical protein
MPVGLDLSHLHGGSGGLVRTLLARCGSLGRAVLVGKHCRDVNVNVVLAVADYGPSELPWHARKVYEVPM